MHSEYSVTDGIVRIDDAVQRAARDQMPALALTDVGNLFGMVKFYGAARAAVLAEGEDQRPEQRRGKRHAPERARRGSDVAQAHEDGGKRDEGRAEEKRGNGRPQARPIFIT